MRRVQLALLAVVAVILVWIGATRDTSAQVPGAAVGSGRFALSMVPASSSGGYYAILLDTQTGRMWCSSEGAYDVGEFTPLRGPMDPHRPTEHPEAAP